MAQHNDLGNQGEQIAHDFLIKKGYKILEQNWRIGRAEVDLIAMDGEVMVFIEVKTRSDNYFGEPESAVNQRKMDLLTHAASVYMYEVNHEWEFRFDVVSILIRHGKTYVTHFEDAFWND